MPSLVENVKLGAIVRIDEDFQEKSCPPGTGDACKRVDTAGHLGVVMAIDATSDAITVYTSNNGETFWYEVDWFSALDPGEGLDRHLLSDLQFEYDENGVKAAEDACCGGCGESTKELRDEVRGLKRRVRESVDEAAGLRVQLRAAKRSRE